jgi:hypothetical protein
LKFLALENALINNDGYWIRTSDYSIYEDVKGRFHIIPHDSNETFMRPEGPGGPGGGRGFGPGRMGGGNGMGGRGEPGGRRGGGTPRPQIKGVELDPLVAANDEGKTLISKLLAVPSLRTRYLGYVREIADKWLDWNKLGPLAQKYHDLIAEDVKADTRKLDSTEAFVASLTGGAKSDAPAPGAGMMPMGREAISLKDFADQRRAYLLKYDPSQSIGTETGKNSAVPQESSK